MTNAGILVKMANPNDRPDNKNNKIPILSLFLFKRLLEIIASNIDKSKNGNNMESNNIHRKSQLKGVIPNMMDEIKAALLLYSRSDIWNNSFKLAFAMDIIRFHI